MSVHSRPTRCPHCADDQLRELARTDHGSPNELDEILFECLSHGHEFVWTEADTDESLTAKMND